MKKYLILICIFIEMLTLMASEVIEKPIYYDSKENVILIHAEFGKAKGYFLFDTGADTSIIFDDQIKYKEHNKNAEYEEISILNMSLNCLKSYATQINLGGVKFKGNYKFTVYNNLELTKFFPDNIKGILGLDIFYNKIFELSIHDGYIRIYENKPVYYLNGITLSPEKPRLYIPIKVDNYSYKALIDTGSNGFIKLPPSEIHYKNKGCVNVIHEKKDIFGNNFSLLKKEKVEFMDIVLKNKIFKTHSHEEQNPIAIIGNKFLYYFNLLIDLKSKNNYKLYYIPRISNEYFSLFTNEEINYIGITDINLEDINFKVYEIIENSAAWDAGLRPGSIITKFNSQPILYYNIEVMKSFLLTPNPVNLTFIDKDGKEKTVTIRARRIL